MGHQALCASSPFLFSEFGTPLIAAKSQTTQNVVTPSLRTFKNHPGEACLAFKKLYTFAAHCSEFVDELTHI